MKVVSIDEYGGPDVLHVAELPTPEPGPGQVRMRVRAAAVNPADFKWRNGMLHGVIPLSFPSVLGYDIAGTVDELGAGVDGFAPGEPVFTILDPRIRGGYAEYVVVAAEELVRIPEGLDFATAAALPTGGLTGVQMVEEYAKAGPGDTVLVTGAVGGVGRFATFAAHQAGARVIAAVRPAQAEEARALGADAVITLGDEAAAVPPFDIVIDTVGGPAVQALCRKLAPGGRIFTASTTPIEAEGLATEPVFAVVHPDAKRMERMARSVEAGDVTMPIGARLPPERAADAHRLVERGGTGGKVVLEF